MTDDELRAELQNLHIGEDSWRAVLLLPLVHVAWADGEIQPQEAELIRAAAHEMGVSESGLKQVHAWLRSKPDELSLMQSKRVIVALAQRHRGLGAELESNTPSRVLALCEQVAEAAGGLFDLAFTVEANERRILTELTHALRVAEDVWLDDLPSPAGGQWEEL